MNENFEKLFVGREEELPLFTQNLDTFFTSDTSTFLKPLVFLIYGDGGIGKTHLSKKLFSITKEKYSKHLVWIDWEKERGHTSHLQTTTQLLDPIIVIDLFVLNCVHSQSEWRHYFQEYYELRNALDELEIDILRLIDIRPDPDNVPVVRNLVSKAGVSLARSLLTSDIESIIEENPRYSGLKEQSEEVQSWKSQIEKLIRKRFSTQQYELFLQPTKVLTEKIALGLKMTSQKNKTIIFMDGYEVIDNVDGIFRNIVRESGSKVAWVISGRRNLLDSQGFGNNSFIGYRMDPPGRLVSIGLGEFSVGNVIDYFKLTTPSRDITRQQAIEIQRATLGIPLAVRQASIIWNSGLDISFITKDIPSSLEREAIIRLMTERMLKHCSDNEDKKIIYALGVMRNGDLNLLASAIDNDDFDALSKNLEHKYPSILVPGTLRLHEKVKAYLKRYLLNEVNRKSRQITQLNQKSIDFLSHKLKKFDTELKTIELRQTDSIWQETALSYVHHNFWLDEDQGWKAFAPYFIEAVVYNTKFASSLLDVLDFFKPILSESGLRRLNYMTIAAQTAWAGDGFELRVSKEFDQMAHRGWFKENEESERHILLHVWKARKLYTGVKSKEALDTIISIKSQLQSEKEGKEYLFEYVGKLLYEISKAIAWPPGAHYATYSKDAEIAANLALEFWQNEADIWRILGLMLARKGLYKEAIEKHLQATRLDPELVLARVELGVWYDLNGQLDDAIDVYKKALAEVSVIGGEDNIHLYNCLGFALLLKEDYDEAIESFEQAILIDPTFPMVNQNLGNCYYIKGDNEKALFYYETAYQTAIQSRDHYITSYSPLYALGAGKIDVALSLLKKQHEAGFTSIQEADDMLSDLEILSKAPHPPRKLDEFRDAVLRYLEIRQRKA